MKALLAVLFAALTLPGIAARAADQTHDQALEGLRHADAQVRRAAADRLAEVGSMTDSAALAAALRDDDEETRINAEQALWRIWARSGDAGIDRQYQTGVAQMGAGDLDSAIETFSQIIRKKPDFAEAWNKRATVYFMAGDWRKSVADCDQVMKRNPQHFGALAGYVLNYIQLEQFERARDYAKKALLVNPNMDAVRQNLFLLEEVLKEKRGKTV